MNPREIEGCILYALLEYGPDAWSACADLTPEHFASGVNGEVFALVRDMHRAGEIVDPYTVAAKDSTAPVSQILKAYFVSRHSLAPYVQMIQDAHYRRRAESIGAALSMGEITSDEAQAQLRAIAPSNGAVVSAKESIRQLIDEIQERIDGGFTGVKTGWADLDRKLIGLMPGDLCLVAARPAMGKTAMALNVLLHQTEPVHVNSLEMQHQQLMRRLISTYGIEHHKLRDCKNLTEDEWGIFSRATAEIGERGLSIDDRGGLPVETICAEIERAVKGRGVKLAVVDYLQLANGTGRNRTEEVGSVTRALKACAKNCRIPIIALSQLSRKVEERPNPVPRLSDLRDSGELEQDADQVIFIYRPEVTREGERPGEADFILAKNRHGETGTVTLAWNGAHQVFRDLAKTDWNWKAA